MARALEEAHQTMRADNHPEDLADLQFEPVSLPTPGPGELTTERLDGPLRRWADSEPMRVLATASGWDWPTEQGTGDLITRLADYSADWDFRKQGGHVERNLIGNEPAVVNGREIPEPLITAAAQALGLVTATPVPEEPVTALVVLSGLVRACVNRTRYAAELMQNGVHTKSVTVLAGHRALGGDEPAMARELGLGDPVDEAEAVVAATQDAFGLGAPLKIIESAPEPSGWDDTLWGESAHYGWGSVDVTVVPSSDPAHRRVNTVDQLRYWARERGINSTDRVLLLTTQIYVPFQQFAGLQVLGIERGCQVYCCGVDAANSVLPGRIFRGRNYLQEIRSALLAAMSLVAAVRESGR
jgi:hypothetical protein